MAAFVLAMIVNKYTKGQVSDVIGDVPDSYVGEGPVSYSVRLHCSYHWVRGNTLPRSQALLSCDTPFT